MIQSGILTEIKKDHLIKRAIKKILSTRTFDRFRANVDGYEAPARLSRASGEGAFVPDMTAYKDGEKSYFEVAIKNTKVKDTIDKWKLMSTLAKLKNGKFYLLVPKGNFAFVNRMLSKHSVHANVIKI